MTTADTVSASTSVVDLVRADYQVDARPNHTRFNEPGWSCQGTTDVSCPACDPPELLISYRRPYTTTQGDYRYWALVCLRCETIVALSDVDDEDKKRIRRWETTFAATEVEPDEDEPDEDEPDEDEPDELTPSGPAAVSVKANHQQVGGVPTSPPPTADHADPPALSDRLEVVRTAARLELDAVEGSERKVDVGAISSDESDALTLRVDQPSMDLSDQVSSEMYLAEEPDAVQRIKVATVVTADSNAVVIKTDDPVADVTGLRLYVVVNPKIVAEAFVQHLENITDAGLAGVMFGDTTLSQGSSIDDQELNTGQRSAVGAIITPGVSAVWGPPGTGKTRVIGEAVARLVRSGHTVAVVSNTNVAVDQALTHVASALSDSEPGTVIRVGHPSIPEVAQHPWLTIQNLIALTEADTVAQVQRHRDSVTALREELDEREEGIQVLRNRSTQEVAAVLARRDGIGRLPAARARHEEAVATTQRLQSLRDDARRGERSAKQHWEDLADHHHLEKVEEDLASREALCADVRTSLEAFRAELLALESGRSLHWRKRRRDRADLEARIAVRTRELDEATEVRDRLRSTLNGAAAAGVTPDRVRTVRLAVKGASDRGSSSDEALRRSSDALKRHADDVARLAAFAPLTDDESELAEFVDRYGSVAAAFARRDEVTEAGRAARDEIARLETLIGELLQQLADLEKTIVENARVVGTTLAQLVLHRGLKSRTFDHVLVDEASAALAPYAFAALTKARLGGTLLGDFEQNGPFSRADPAELSQAARPWLVDHPFARVGVRDANDAQEADGCVVLTRQYRFGPVTMNLANDVAYAGLLELGLAAPDGATTEIALVDVSDLGASADTYRVTRGPGRWSPAGAAIVGELTQRFGPDTLGIITPYRAQAALISARLQDLHLRGAQVGTAHRFQGREFPHVVLDMVQDASGRDWIARAQRAGNSWQRAGVRLFTVGVTRSTEQLIIIGHKKVIGQATAGPLQALRKLIDAGAVPVWSAAELIGTTPITPPPVLAEPAQPTDATLLDDRSFFESFRRDVDRARSQVIVFSPFVGAQRLPQVLPFLQSAVKRGVKVFALTKSQDELTHPVLLDQLAAAGIDTLPKHGRHEKIVIIDYDISYIGSLNALSNTGRTDEVMMRFEGHDMTKRITDWMRAAV